ncbi:MAG: CDP-alcohol phosphatidyltransferase family protein [Desulfovibrionaceae bacterium]|nr:CDP-alcohol phosphatidyltransferase family protein [Desulfovibrionaceae bacterium]MDD4951160.1 CDP-alcohol phosphatidyltransferase family protein [Desulfovibrionaceae bacterium]
MTRENNWTIPNLLSIVRVLLTPAFVMAYLEHRFALAWVLFGVAGLTDALDGFLARLLKQRSRLGSMLDPLADKILLVTSFICLTMQGWIPSWLTVIVVTRDVIILGGLALLHFFGVEISRNISPLCSSKITTSLQIILVLFVMFQRTFSLDYPQLQEIIVAATAFMTMFSGLHYVLRGLAFFPANGGNGD